MQHCLGGTGLVEDFGGARVGKHLLANFGTGVSNLARAKAAAAADARMDGCQMPVVINSGSGNQGITVSLPVVVYAQHYKLSEERLMRALCVSNLIAIHQKPVSAGYQHIAARSAPLAVRQRP